MAAASKYSFAMNEIQIEIYSRPKGLLSIKVIVFFDYTKLFSYEYNLQLK